MANIFRKVASSPKVRAIKRKRAKLQAQLKKLGRKYRVTFKSEARRLGKKKRTAKKTRR